MLGDHPGREGGCPGPPFDRGDVGTGDGTVEAELQERLGVFEGLEEAGRVVLEQVARVLADGQVGDADFDLVLLLPSVPAFGGALAGGVGVVGQDDPPGEVLQHLEVLVGERGTASGHRVGGAGEHEAHDVGVPLADDDLAVGHDLALRPVEPVQQAALVVDRRLG